MGTESHGSEWIWLTPRSWILLRLLRLRFKDRRAAEYDIVNVTEDNARLLFSGTGKKQFKHLNLTKGGNRYDSIVHSQSGGSWLMRGCGLVYDVSRPGPREQKGQSQGNRCGTSTASL
jgi:hypothetical protein